MKPPSTPNTEAAEIQFYLANAWHVRGNFEQAVIQYQEALKLQPNYARAYEQLGNLMMKQRQVEEALEYYERALDLDFEATNLSSYYRCLGWNKNAQTSIQLENISFPTQTLTKAAKGKINLGRQRIFRYHRSG